MVEISYSEQEMVTQSDIKKIEEIVEILVVEVDKKKYEEYISSKSASPARRRHYCHVSARVMDLDNKEIPIH